MSKSPRILRKRKIKNNEQDSIYPNDDHIYWGLCLGVFICLGILSILSFVISANADCPSGIMAQKQLGQEKAVSYYVRCALDTNDEISQYWLAQYYQKIPNRTNQDIMKMLLFYHLAAENGNAHAQVQLAKILLNMDNNDTDRAVLSSYIEQMQAFMKNQNMMFKGEILHPYILLTLASENAEQKWYYPTKFKSNAEATILLKSFQIDDDKKKMLLQQGSQWKQRKMKETAYEIMSLKEYNDFINTVYPEKGRPDAFVRQQAVMNLKNKVENYLKQ